MNKQAILEGLLFIVGDDGISLEKASNILEISEEETKDLFKHLQKEYEKEERGIRISFLANSFKLTTKKEHIEYYKKLVNEEENPILSQAALETLILIAYNQPITRVEIDNIRGISSAFLIKKLQAKDLIKVSGKSNLPGHPNLYTTTNSFLDYFGLASLNDLPEMKNEEKQDEEVDLYKSKYTESE